MDKNTLVKLLGLTATVLHGDTAVFDRWCWFKKYLQGGLLRTLDAGCGSGAFTMYATKIGNEAVGVSFDERNNEAARERAEILGLKNIRFLTADLRKLDTLAEEIGVFDQIICFETIEHIINDKKLIADFASLLKPDGRLLLTAPYKYYKRFLGNKISDYEDGGHVRWGYTHKEMKKMLEEQGFRIEVEEYITGYISQHLIYLQRFLSKINSRLAWVIVFPFRVFQYLDQFLMKIIKYPFLSIGVVAVKT